ncbi:MAG: aldehyde dehydrogenase family protein, partial [Oscillatoriales cyanobacterium SM2_2_1]|nr:aldehyde dehydrogenase family protein [Oscillatoriales cyanobacterium SM2_2_1]
MFDPYPLLQQQRNFFATGATRPESFRRQQLAKLATAIKKHEAAVIEALHQDCRKPPLESFGSEVLLTLSELQYGLKHLRGWMRPQRVGTPASQFRSTAVIYPEPKGIVLIVGPWNYPFQLVLVPLIGAIAAGNCAVLKPSEHAPATSALLAKLVAETFDPAFVAVVEGGIPENQALLAEPWDHLFFTGGTAIGRIVMAAAAKHLTPVTLELGGKSPCIVDGTIDLAIAAKRIAWGKFINCGQTCIAPDYILVAEAVKEPLVAALRQVLGQFYGAQIEHNPDYGRIINQRQFDRLVALLPEATGEGVLRFGGRHRREDLFLEPTLVDDLHFTSKLMAEEIFGPILPILTYQCLEEVVTQVRSHPKPLALYIFSQDP